MERDYRRLSLWFDTVPDDLTARPALGSDIEVDVAIAGAGYTGLWTAYYLALADPTLRIAVLEKEIAGFGASGRNGGWASAVFSASGEKVATRHGREAAVALQRAMFDTVDEIGRVCARESIDAHYCKGGTLTLATARSHVIRLKQALEASRSFGLGEDDLRWLGPHEVGQRINVGRALGATYTPHCAAIHPARLVRGLARAVERLGVTIYERTPVQSLEPNRLRTPGGEARSPVVVHALEGYTPTLPGHRRTLVPIYSLMIATEPLPASTWDAIGWNGRETLTDDRHLIIYAQRTADGRIAIGGRGAPYHFGSRVDESFDREPALFDKLGQALRTLLPAAGEAAITHRWGGPLGVPRDWYSSVAFDPATGVARAGGYVGDGVSTANLAGRTLADLICERTTELTSLPWIGHKSRKWEPEPLRWVGANVALRTMSGADKAEARTGRPARRAALASRLIGA